MKTITKHGSEITQEDNNRNLGIDALRGAAAIAVLFLHAREVLWVGLHATQIDSSASIWNLIFGWGSLPFRWGHLGVPLFFIISGYCIHKPHLQRAKRNPAYRLGIQEYMKRRFLRIYPVLVGAVLLTASLDTITRAYTPADPKLGDNSVFCAMMNLASLQGYFSPFYGTNGPLWTLGMEIHFYVFYPLLFLAFRRFKGVNVAATLLVISILAWLAAVNGLVSKSSFLPYWFCWTVGAFIAECQYSSTEWPLKCMVTLSIPCLILALSADFWNRFVPFPSPVLFTIAVPPLGVIVWWVVNRSIWNGRFVSILASTGEFSYSLYATHLPVIVAYRAVFQNGKPSGDFLSIIPGIAVAIIFAKIFFLCVEKWSIRVPKTVRPKH